MTETATSPSTADKCLAKALEAKSVKLVDRALSQGADPNLSLYWRGSELTALACAAAQSKGAAIIDVLLRAGADPNGLSPAGLGPLHVVGSPEAVSRLVQAGADPNGLTKQGDTPLHCCQTPACARALLEAGARLELSNYAGLHAFEMVAIAADRWLDHFPEHPAAKELRFTGELLRSEFDALRLTQTVNTRTDQARRNAVSHRGRL